MTITTPLANIIIPPALAMPLTAATPCLTTQTHACDEYRADLHNHTTFSDGSLTPTQLVANAKQLDLSALAITDHDTIDGLDEALQAGKDHGVDIVCGAELSLKFLETFFRGTLHLLLYFPDHLLTNASFRSDISALMAQGRGECLVRARIKAINEYFGPNSTTPMLKQELAFEDFAPYGRQVSRRHFELVLQQPIFKHGEQGLTQNAHGFSHDEIYEMIGNNAPSYVPSGINIEDTKDFFKRWPQVLKVFAHPAAGSFPKESHYKEVLPPFETVLKLLPRFLALGLDGLEVYYPGHTNEWIKFLVPLVSELGLTLATGGSDSHDTSKRPLGTASASYDVVEQMRRIWNQ